MVPIGWSIEPGTSLLAIF